MTQVLVYVHINEAIEIIKEYCAYIEMRINIPNNNMDVVEDREEICTVTAVAPSHDCTWWYCKQVLLFYRKGSGGGG